VSGPQAAKSTNKLSYSEAAMTKRSILATAAVAAICAATAAADAAGSVLVGDKEMAAARQATVHSRHALPARNANGVRRSEARTLRGEGSAGNTRGADGGSAGSETTGVRYPADLQYHGGAVVLSAQSHPVYVNTNATCPNNSCWGNPEAFLHDLADSKLIHVVDQYVGSAAPRRYTLGSSASVTIPTTSGVPLTDDQVRAAVFAVASATGQAGYGHVYHVFLPPGQDECADSTLSECYSPDNPATFAFCAFHSSVTFQGLGDVLFSVQPYQNVTGCQVRPGTPNGQLVDSTNDVLSHELIETITDPDVTAWWNGVNITVIFQEIADLCVFFTPDLLFTDPPNIIANGKLYAVQSEYSNRHHACVTSVEDE
jgi:hypothetical protein